jgi:hypothetical protein
MNTQHTPGPWTTDGNAESGNLDIISPLGRVAMMDCDHDLTAIDAQLIAAAPDLLAALQMVDRIWSHDQTSNIDPTSPLAIVRAAIAKATGENT